MKFDRFSLGTVPTVDLASRLKDCCAACVLHSPLTSGMRVAFPETNRTWCCDAFPSIDKIHRIRAPTLVIHGTEDEVIHVSHGFALYNRIEKQHQIEPLWVDGAGHNDVEVNFFEILFHRENDENLSFGFLSIEDIHSIFGTFVKVYQYRYSK